MIGPMQYDCNGQTWREVVKNRLSNIGILTLDPYNHPFINSQEENDEVRENLREELEKGNYDIVSRFFKQIRAEDLRMVDLSDFIICYINPKIPTIGTIEELAISCRQQKPIFLVIEGGKKKAPYWLFGMLNHNYMYGSFEEMLFVIERINNGDIKLSSSKWKLLKPELR